MLSKCDDRDALSDEPKQTECHETSQRKVALGGRASAEEGNEVNRKCRCERCAYYVAVAVPLRSTTTYIYTASIAVAAATVRCHRRVLCWCMMVFGGPPLLYYKQLTSNN